MGLKEKLSQWKYIQIRRIYWASSLCPMSCVQGHKRKQKGKKVPMLTITDCSLILSTQTDWENLCRYHAWIHLTKEFWNFTDHLHRRLIPLHSSTACPKNIWFFIPINNSSHISSLSHAIPQSPSSILVTTTHLTCVKILPLSWFLSSMLCFPSNTETVSFLKSVFYTKVAQPKALSL